MRSRSEAPISRAAWAAASVMALGGFLGNMDGSIVAVGLESMRANLHTGLGEIQWVVTAYLLGLSAVLALTPWLVRGLGAGRLWLSALAAFILTSAVCALTSTAPPLIAARAVQRMTAGVLVAAGQTVIGLAVGPARLGRMMATLGLVVGLAPIVGPSVGGFLLAHLAWPALFWLNVPIGAVAMLLGLRLVPRGDRSRPPPMDWPGLALVSAGMPLWFQLARPGLGLDRPAARPARPGHHSDHVRRGPAHRPVRRRHGRDGRLAGGAGEHRAVPMAGPALANLTMRVGGAIGGALCVVVLSVSYGGLSGGLSAVEALRPVFAELHAVTIRKTVSLHNTWGDFPAEPATDALRRLTHQLLWWSGATHEALRRAPYPG